MVNPDILTKVRAYAELVSKRMPVKRIVLFGSFARGNSHNGSDIDIAVILKEVPDNIWKTEAELFRLAREVDFRIEPILVDETNDPSGFWEEISSYGEMVFNIE